MPPWFKRQPQLVLQIGLNMPVPIPDLDVSDHGLSCTLSFNRSPFHCQIPWPSVFALVGESGRGMVWPDDVPPEVAAQAQKQQQAKPQLAAVQAPAPAAEEAAAEETAPAAANALSGQGARSLQTSGELEAGCWSVRLTAAARDFPGRASYEMNLTLGGVAPPEEDCEGEELDWAAGRSGAFADPESWSPPGSPREVEAE